MNKNLFLNISLAKFSPNIVPKDTALDVVHDNNPEVRILPLNVGAFLATDIPALYAP